MRPVLIYKVHRRVFCLATLMLAIIQLLTFWKNLYELYLRFFAAGLSLFNLNFRLFLRLKDPTICESASGGIYAAIDHLSK